MPRVAATTSACSTMNHVYRRQGVYTLLVGWCLPESPTDQKTNGPTGYSTTLKTISGSKSPSITGFCFFPV